MATSSLNIMTRLMSNALIDLNLGRALGWRLLVTGAVGMLLRRVKLGYPVSLCYSGILLCKALNNGQSSQTVKVWRI